MHFSQIFFKWVDFVAKTENQILLEFFLNWNESVAKTKNEILLEIFLKSGINLQLRQKMILSSNKLVELEVVCG